MNQLSNAVNKSSKLRATPKRENGIKICLFVKVKKIVTFQYADGNDSIMKMMMNIDNAAQRENK